MQTILSAGRRGAFGAAVAPLPTAKELGYDVVGNSPYGLVGPKGMDPAVVKTLHDGFKKAMDDPKHQELLDQLNQDAWYKSGDEYAAWAKAPMHRSVR